MKSLNEFIKLPDSSLKEMLKKQGTHIPKAINHETLLDYAINKLHGIEFIHSNEKESKGKIIQINRTPKPVPTETCPNCTQKTLRKLNVPSDNTYHNYSYCSYCGLYRPPPSEKTIKPIEAKN